jgi:predicted HicB family RNase H-like nuclease
LSRHPVYTQRFREKPHFSEINPFSDIWIDMSRKQIKEKAERYRKFVTWSDEDQCFIGRCPELFEGGVHGLDTAQVYRELCGAVEEWIAFSHQAGAPLPEPSGRGVSGKFVVRVEPALHRRLERE